MFYVRDRIEKKFKARIELFDEKTNETVRTISFKNPKDFENFLEDFKLIRYPGYKWRYIDKNNYLSKSRYD